MENTKKKAMSDEERLELATKLDQELTEFIDGLEKRPYDEGWPEDHWQEEMEKHPFFMKKPPEAGEQLSPLMEGLQQLKYDPNENTSEELALAYKDDGNFNFKHKNYRLAIIAYTEGIQVKCNNAEIDATLYNNRAAANYFLKNYRSALRDSEWALKSKPYYDKATLRAANCCLEMKQFDKAIAYCDTLLSKNEDVQVSELRQKCLNAKKQHERDMRKSQQLQNKKNINERNLIVAIADAGIKCKGALRPQVPELANNMVHLNGDKLTWPVIFTYPEYRIMEFIQTFCEDETFRHHINNVLDEHPEWDVQRKYNTETVRVYFETCTSNTVHLVDLDKSLRDVLRHKEYVKSTDYVVMNKSIHVDEMKGVFQEKFEYQIFNKIILLIYRM